MTKEQYEKLNKYDEQLNTAYYGNYVRRLYSVALNELDEMYKQLFPNAPDSKLKTGCSSCVLKALKKMAQEYFNYQPPQPKQEDENKMEITTINTTEQDETIGRSQPVKPRGRKKKPANS